MPLKGTRQDGLCILIEEAKQVTIEHTGPEWCASATQHVGNKLWHEALCKLYVGIDDTICRPPNLTDNDGQSWKPCIGERGHKPIIACIKHIGINMWTIHDIICCAVEKCESQREIGSQNQA